ncbi:hypothetical protein FYC77_00345 [Natrialba swarupiae]|uniref:Uncharacterized protein n=2 Tax=Natrialba swarupiae TaxID=2448032 RepID=A0A5D5ASB3_9EURY|nr:hypothetical protein FYC77_00345 [Natrialba swarupiae]
MSPNPVVTEVFEDVEPDPDAILASSGAESADELLEAGGDHDPTTDDEIDATADDLEGLFDGLDRLDTAPDPLDGTADSEPVEFGRETDAVLVGEPTVTIRSSDDAGDLFPESNSKSVSECDDDRSRSGFELVGPEPTAERIGDEAFGDGLASEFCWFGAGLELTL